MICDCPEHGFILSHRPQCKALEGPSSPPATATLWRAIVVWKVPAEPAPVQQAPSVLMLTTADPSGVEVFAVARARVLELEPRAVDVTLIELNRAGEVFGTVARNPGARS